MAIPEVSFVIPLYNEQQAIPLLVNRLNALMDKMEQTAEVVLVNDGSKDSTPEMMKSIALTDSRYQAVFLSRNYGHQIAISAGIAYANGSKAIMILDGDLQDPPELFHEFYSYYEQGHDVVYAIRKKRKETLVKKISYHLFYRLLKSIAYIDLPIDSGDFCLMSRKVADVLKSMPEESRYVRGMRSWIGFKQIGVEYERAERAEGEPKYSFRMLFRLAFNGIFNFSEFPIKFITRLGIATTLFSLLYLTITLIKKFMYNTVPEGFTALLFTITLFSGVQLLSLGLIGEYVLRIFFQVKNRPLFIIKNRILNKSYTD